MNDQKKTDDEVVLDIAKVKSWFGKIFKDQKEKKASEQKTKQEHHIKTHNETNTNTREPDTTKTKDDSDVVNIDWSTVSTFFKKYGAIFLLLIPLLLTVYLRLQPMYLPVTDEWAQSTVHNYYHNQVSNQISQQYPNLPTANKKSLIDSEFQNILEQNKDVIDQQIRETSNAFKEKLMYESGDSKYVYLGDIDSYYWLREVRKIEENGRNCDDIDYENNVCYTDTYTVAPLRNKQAEIGKEFTNPYVHSVRIVYKVMKIFNPDVTIMQASFYTPLIYALLSVILAFLLGRALAGNFAGFITSIFITVNPIFLSRTLGSDNDPQNMLYPLAIVLFFIYAFQSKDLKKQLLYGSVAGLATGLFAWGWFGWWYIFDFLVGTAVAYLLFLVLRGMLSKVKFIDVLKNAEIIANFRILLIYVVVTSVFTLLLSSTENLMNAIEGPLWFMSTKIAALESFWPNVLVTVAEFNPGSISSIIGQIGGKIIFFMGLLGILISMYPKKKAEKKQKYLFVFGAITYMVLVSKFGQTLGQYAYMFLLLLPVLIGALILLKSKTEVDVKMSILLVVWFIATIYAALKGVRFTLLMVSAFGIALGITYARIYEKVPSFIHKILRLNEKLAKGLVLVVLLLFLMGSVKAGHFTATHFVPSVNDAWFDSLTKVKDNSEPDAIINSWWDFGHWFKYLADRRVTLDGGSQSGPPLHWLGKLMATNDEQQSVGILRMLDCGSNRAFDKLNDVVNDTPKSIDILDVLVTKERPGAYDMLIDNGLTQSQAEEVLKYSHCDAPENFFITSEDMVGKAGVWSHFGTWDFKRAEMYTRVKGKTLAEGTAILSEPKFNLTSAQVDQYYYDIQSQPDNTWITDWPTYLSGVQGCQPVTADGMLICSMNAATGQSFAVQINLTDMDTTIVGTSRKMHSVVYPYENGTDEVFMDGDTVPMSIVLIPGANGFSAILAQPVLANSIFTRLFYLEGHGLKYFDKFDDRRQVTGGRILVWKIDWNGTDRNTPYLAEPPSETKEIEDKPVETIDDSKEDVISETTEEETVGDLEEPEEKIGTTAEAEIDPLDEQESNIVEKDIEISI